MAAKKSTSSRLPKRAPAKKTTESKSKRVDEPANVRDETHETPNVKSRKVSESEAEFIDKDPGYSAEQLDQMAEYYGTKKNVQTSGDVAEVTTTGLAGQK